MIPQHLSLSVLVKSAAAAPADNPEDVAKYRRRRRFAAMLLPALGGAAIGGVMGAGMGQSTSSVRTETPGGSKEVTNSAASPIVTALLGALAGGTAGAGLGYAKAKGKEFLGMDPFVASVRGV